MFHGRHIWIVPLVTSLVVAAIGWWADGLLRRVVQQEIRDDLESTLEANVTALEVWMANQKRIALALAEEPRLNSLALDILGHSSAGPTNRAAVADLARQLIVGERFMERVQTLGFATAQLLSTNLVIVSTEGRGRGRIGGAVPEELRPKFRELLERGEPVIVTPFKPRRLELLRRNLTRPGGMPPRPFFTSTNLPAPTMRDPSVMQVAAPVKDADGKVKGILVLVINPDAEFTRILSVARSGESGETFAFDAGGVMLSESRFDDELRQAGLIEPVADSTSALNLRLHDPGGRLGEGYRPETNAPLMLLVERAITGESGVEMEPARDYRGVPVVGASTWLFRYRFGVVTKLDAREAFQTLRMVRTVFLILFLLLLLATLVILAFSYSHVLWRRRLTEAELKARQLGQYRLIGKIGEGGMGSVYKARHALLRRETALKLLPPDKAEPQAVQRFEQEVQLTCRLAHPNTIQVFDYGHTPDGIFYYAMELLDGLNLDDLVTRFGSQPEERVIHILRQVCGSLGEAHALGLIHRDIKPANVFLTDRGGVPDNVKVLDFGLVRHFGPNASNANLPEFVSQDGIVGTPNFIAPECLRSSDAADARSDIYSVGVLAYFLLTGQYIFESSSVAEVCRRHLDDLPETLSERTGRRFDPQLEALVMRCLAKDPAARPQSAAELAGALGRCAAADLWTPERRAAWWTAYRQAPVPPAPVAHPESSTLQATVKIDFGERTP